MATWAGRGREVFIHIKTDVINTLDPLGGALVCRNVTPPTFHRARRRAPDSAGTGVVRCQIPFSDAADKGAALCSDEFAIGPFPFSFTQSTGPPHPWVHIAPFNSGYPFTLSSRLPPSHLEVTNPVPPFGSPPSPDGAYSTI